MRKRPACASVFAALVLLSSPALAASSPAPGVSAGRGIMLVDGGCGPTAYRAGNGYCYRKPAYAPPPAYAPGYYPPGYAPGYAPDYYRRACPPAYHPTPYGCRPNW